jgi:hypothetical protein
VHAEVRAHRAGNEDFAVGDVAAGDAGVTRRVGYDVAVMEVDHRGA